MTEQQIKKHARYWFLSAQHDYETMLGLFKMKYYPDSLFYGHIVLEKALKAVVVLETSKPAPLIHDLVILARLTKIEIGNQEKRLLESISRFNIRARYPDYKLEFYKICNRNYTLNYLNRTIIIYKRLCQHPKLKLLLNDSPNS